ncbi:hypothetical protein [Bradyrhizobium zhanjiangense]|uniref:Uncharacterized protein n=1 Tax=Bradyrhizobium zhanjiangense TaxID=1325107 RepID=A0A4Q0SM49_9BRAD|nr:hypothetical protein [Bradyrhizobium zhanjiangense]RXH40657.1 hypothetical protein XH94_11095 [Bradyrhizobium zhanjiangense]
MFVMTREIEETRWEIKIVQGAERRSRSRHCEELLRRSNPDCLCGKILDCFAALAMTEDVALTLVQM